jgi:CO/xanthine dehydrogenase FAD-binding subunit
MRASTRSAEDPWFDATRTAGHHNVQRMARRETRPTNREADGMDINTVRRVVRPTSRADLPSWAAGDAWLGGGTWLFSEPQPCVERLIDLDGFGWPSLVRDQAGLQIAATCRISELFSFDPPDDWAAATLFRPCCEALLASFKIWNAATVGGNLCLALPAGAMIALLAALEGTCTIWQPGGGEHQVAVSAFVSDVNRTVLQPGELLRSVALPVSALRRTSSFRRTSPSRFGRASALLIGTRGNAFSLTISAATRRPIRLDLASVPLQSELREAIDTSVPRELYVEDADATAVYRRHMTYHLAEEIRLELADGADRCRSS